VKELRTPLYRIQLFQRKPRLPFAYGTKTPQITELSEQPVPLPPGLEDQVLWQGGAPMQPAAESPVVTDRLPILTYHRVAPSGSQALAPYRVTPEMFEAHLRYLRDGGYYSVSLEDWQAAMQEHTPLPGRAVLITFDDGYKDIQEYAYPLLSQYGFTAMVFLVADEVGGSNRWDHRFGEQLPLLGWDEIHQLSAAGFAFGSHSASHRDLRDVSPIEVVRQALRSRRILEAGLKLPVRAFAYPHGGENRLIRHILGACGYIFGLTTQPSRCSLWDPLLALPRLDMHGMDRFEDFVRKLADG
jgi:peptidoglycan/xylan/chitin deacetylase (PgdA/CDA1 family)